MDDRRVHHRFAAGTPVHVRVATRAAFAQEYLLNISRGGCFIVSDAQVRGGELVAVRFEIAGQVSVILDGEVTHATLGPPRGFGVRFKDVGMERLSDLDEFIAGTVGEMSRKAGREDTQELPRSLIEDLLKKSEAAGDGAVGRSDGARPGQQRPPIGDAAAAWAAAEARIGFREVTPMEIDVDLIADAVEEPSGEWLAVEPQDEDPTELSGGPSTAPNPSAEPPTPAEGGDPVAWVEELVEHMLGRLGGESLYAVLGAGAEDTTDAIQARARRDLGRLAKARAVLPPDNDGLADQLDALESTIQAAMDDIGDPTQRASLDLSLGHFTPAGRTPQELLALAASAEALRGPWVRENPVMVNRAAVFGKAAEREAAAGEVDRALQSAQRAVGLDPYNLDLRELLATVEGMMRTRVE